MQAARDLQPVAIATNIRPAAHTKRTKPGRLLNKRESALASTIIEVNV